MTPPTKSRGHAPASEFTGARWSEKWTRPRDGDLWTQGRTPTGSAVQVPADGQAAAEPAGGCGMSARVPSIRDLFPAAGSESLPFAVEVGECFDTVALPAAAARQLLRLCARHRPHPVGAAIARGDEWVLILPPSSGDGTDWPPLVNHRNSGSLVVPPLNSGLRKTLHWARRGNEDGRVFTAPIHLHALAPLLVPERPARPGPTGLLLDRTPVRI